MTAQLRTITPAQAARLLRTTIQPRVELSKILEYAAAMDAGRWKPDLHINTPIKVGRRGRLRNGHHRIVAVLVHGRPVEFWVEGDPDGIPAV
jgi:hypothetical protein